MPSMWNKAINAIETGIKGIANNQLKMGDQRILSEAISKEFANASSVNTALKTAFGLDVAAYSKAGVQQKVGAVMGLDLYGQMGEQIAAKNWGGLAFSGVQHALGGSVLNNELTFRPHVAAARATAFGAGTFVGLKAAGLGLRAVSWPFRAAYDQIF